MACSRSNTGPGAGGARSLLAEFFRKHGPVFDERHRLFPGRARALRDILRCRTAALGGHVYECNRCGHSVPVYNSCLNRNCPQCQAFAQARWIAARKERLLPVGHHHVVFTIPDQLRPLARHAPKHVFAALFEAVSKTLEQRAREDWKAHLGFTAVLHTWTRTLAWHPHLHCVVTAGGLTLDGQRWVPHTGFLFSVERMKTTFREHLLASLKRRVEAGDIVLPGDQSAAERWQALCRSLPHWRKWVVYIEPPFGRSTHVIEYLGRYTHRIGISDARVVCTDDRGITFRTRGDDTITLGPDDFIGRFLQHVLPAGFHKIRHYGLYAATRAKTLWKRAVELLGDGDRHSEDDSDGDRAAIADADTATLLGLLTGVDPQQCPLCHVGRLTKRPVPRARSP